jgi:hypothetical protein
MTPKPKRPIGITLLALMFLWIGCLGSLFLPVIILGGGTLDWTALPTAYVHSASLARFVSYVLVLLWFLLYVFYAFIGFGLWKLRNWARKAVIAISVFAAVLSLLVLPFFVRPVALALAMIVCTVVPFAWQIWYLKRPRVCFAFGVVPEQQEGSSISEPQAGTSTKGKIWVATGIALTLTAFVGVLMFAVENIIHESEIYRTTLAEAQSSQCVATAIGSPWRPGWMTTGGMEESGEKGSANLSIPVHGSKGKGDLLLEAEKRSGAWKITSLVLSHGSEQIQITPATSNCR